MKLSIGSTDAMTLLRTRLRRWRLDHELAEGVEGELNAEQAVRARQLATRDTCDELARSLRQAVAQLDHPRAAQLGSAVPILRDVVAPHREALLGLADRLQQPVELNPRGVARLLLLLTDGGGPLYSRFPDRSLPVALWWVADGLQPCSPHVWRSPEESRALRAEPGWTCARCGALAGQPPAPTAPLE